MLREWLQYYEQYSNATKTSKKYLWKYIWIILLLSFYCPHILHTSLWSKTDPLCIVQPWVYIYYLHPSLFIWYLVKAVMAPATISFVYSILSSSGISIIITMLHVQKHRETPNNIARLVLSTHDWRISRIVHKCVTLWASSIMEPC